MLGLGKKENFWEGVRDHYDSLGKRENFWEPVGDHYDRNRSTGLEIRVTLLLLL